jgi:hypothetical protein
MSKLSHVEIQEINRRIAAGTYKHEPDTIPDKPKPKPRTPKAKKVEDDE